MSRAINSTLHFIEGNSMLPFESEIQKRLELSLANRIRWHLDHFAFPSQASEICELVILHISPAPSEGSMRHQKDL